MTRTLPPSIDDIERIAQAVAENLPDQFRRWMADVVLRVEDFPDEETCEEMQLDTPFDLLGLYNGEPVGEKGSGGTAATPDVILLYRRPILDYWAETGESLEAVVTHVMVHEAGHHFGLSDEDMERIEAEAQR